MQAVFLFTWRVKKKKSTKWVYFILLWYNRLAMCCLSSRPARISCIFCRFHCVWLLEVRRQKAGIHHSKRPFSKIPVLHVNSVSSGFLTIPIWSHLNKIRTIFWSSLSKYNAVGIFWECFCSPGNSMELRDVQTQECSRVWQWYIAAAISDTCPSVESSLEQLCVPGGPLIPQEQDLKLQSRHFSLCSDHWISSLVVLTSNSLATLLNRNKVVSGLLTVHAVVRDRNKLPVIGV